MVKTMFSGPGRSGQYIARDRIDDRYAAGSQSGLAVKRCREPHCSRLIGPDIVIDVAIEIERSRCRSPRYVRPDQRDRSDGPRDIVDDVDGDRAGGRVAVGVGHLVGEGLDIVLRGDAVVSGRPVNRRGQRVAVRAVRIEVVSVAVACRSGSLSSAERVTGAKTPGVTHCPTTVPLTVSAVLDGLLPVASAASFTVRSSFDAARLDVRQRDRQRRRRQVAVAVPDRVDEHVGGVRRDVVAVL